MCEQQAFGMITGRRKNSVLESANRLSGYVDGITESVGVF